MQNKGEAVFYNCHNEIIEKPADAPVTWRPSAYAFVINTNKEVLVIRTAWGRTWELPGGGVEPTENLVGAVIREGQEETGYQFTVKAEDLLTFHERYFYSLDVKTFHHSLLFFFKAELASDAQDTSHVDVKEVAKIAWVPLADLTEQNCHHIIWPTINKMKNDL